MVAAAVDVVEVVDSGVAVVKWRTGEKRDKGDGSGATCRVVAGRPHPPAVVGAVITVGAGADEGRSGDDSTVVHASKWWEDRCCIPSPVAVIVGLAVAAAVNAVEGVTVP